jgi:archaellum biogenesis ATPase FlaH
MDYVYTMINFASMFLPLGISYSIDALFDKRKEVLKRVAYFIKSFGYDIKLIDLVEAPLFFSMIPLRQDSQKKIFTEFIQATKSLSIRSKTNF